MLLPEKTQNAVFDQNFVETMCICICVHMKKLHMYPSMLIAISSINMYYGFRLSYIFFLKWHPYLKVMMNLLAFKKNLVVKFINLFLVSENIHLLKDK